MQNPYLTSATMLRKGNVFTPVCQSECSQEGLYTPPRQALPMQTPAGKTPSPPTATAADSTHPTAMHSCYEKCWILGHEVKFLHTGIKC